jgi:hypothetical protein
VRQKIIYCSCTARPRHTPNGGTDTYNRAPHATDTQTQITQARKLVHFDKQTKFTRPRNTVHGYCDPQGSTARMPLAPTRNTVYFGGVLTCVGMHNRMGLPTAPFATVTADTAPCVPGAYQRHGATHRPYKQGNSTSSSRQSQAVHAGGMGTRIQSPNHLRIPAPTSSQGNWRQLMNQELPGCGSTHLYPPSNNGH